jgi:hypothetical protein
MLKIRNMAAMRNITDNHHVFGMHVGGNGLPN